MARNGNEMSDKERELLGKILGQLGLDERSEEGGAPTRRWVASDEMRDALLHVLLQRDLAVARVAAAEAWSGGEELRRFDDIVRAGSACRAAVEAYLEAAPELRASLEAVEDATAKLRTAETMKEARAAAVTANVAVQTLHRLRQKLVDRGRALVETKFQTRLITGGTPYAAAPGSAEGRNLPGYDPARGPLLRRIPGATAPTPPPARSRPSARTATPAGQRALFAGGSLDD